MPISNACESTDNLQIMSMVCRHWCVVIAVASWIHGVTGSYLQNTRYSVYYGCWLYL